MEHVPVDQLSTFAQTIFTIGFQVIVFTTPNAEFNIKFPGYSGQFRDDDHKFEWTRGEFQNWCQLVASNFGYDVKFSGVGVLSGEQYDEKYGYCTQSAIFIKQMQSSSKALSDNQGKSLKLFAQISYPYFDASSFGLEDIARYIKDEIFPHLEDPASFTIKQLWSYFPVRQRCQGKYERLENVYTLLMKRN